MVSPSKVQRKQQNQSLIGQELDKCSHVCTNKRLKPLERKSFYLDIKNHGTSAKLEAKIKDLGGATELFLVRSVYLVVTDRLNKTSSTNPEKLKWGCTSGGSGGPPSLRSIEISTPGPTPPTPLLSSECPLSNSTNLRGQTTQRSKSRVDAMLERALIQPQQCSVDPLDNAQSWGIPIWATGKFQAWLDKIYVSFKDTNNLKRLKHTSQYTSGKDLKVKHLKSPYIKFESFQRTTRPVFLELAAWPQLNFSGYSGSCPFDIQRQEKLDKGKVKEIKENTRGISSANKDEGKEMTRRPRNTTNRTRRTEQLITGYCEICRINYRDLSKHVQSDQHMNFVQNDDNFLSLDTLINAGASVEAFLKLNRPKNIAKDCPLYPNGDRNLHSAVLPEQKIDKTSKALNNFNVEQIKMVQCNGTRRNLNLKLSSSHNLRARTKHESGHLLRSKGSPWHEVDKSEKFYDKFEGFTIKKRAKGTIWIEEEDPDDNYVPGSELNESKRDYISTSVKEIDKVFETDSKSDEIKNKHNNFESQNEIETIISGSGRTNCIRTELLTPPQQKVHNDFSTEKNLESLANDVNISEFASNCFSNHLCKPSKEIFKKQNCEVLPQKLQSDAKTSNGCDRLQPIIVCNGHSEKSDQKNFKTFQHEMSDAGNEKPKCSRLCRRGGRSVRGRHRLSVEERLIEDNRAYYKVEVLGNKLRSSAILGCNSYNVPSRDIDTDSKKESPSSEKPVVVRFKRVRKSELSLLSDEAESFMFGESKRDEFSETSDGEQSSVLPRDTESDCNESISSVLHSSYLNSSSPIKQEIVEEDSQDSLSLGRARKRRRTHAEALIKDNADYYKFETPGSRLRYQAPLSSIKGSITQETTVKSVHSDDQLQIDFIEKIYPSKPSPEVEKMQFSFEAVPTSEPWYQTYQRQDEGAEFWHYFSEGDTRKPFLLPYEIENFHETLMKNQSKSDGRRKMRGRSSGCTGRSPRKSPRCHASTLAIMSTIIRKREQQQQTPNLCTVEECELVRSQFNTPRPEMKQYSKSEIDEELKEIAKNIDEMLCMKNILELEDSFEPDNLQTVTESNSVESHIPKGPPPNLLELLDHCHEIGNCLENSSCASSECGEANSESPLKRRKKRKNRTGWPGIKMRKKLQNKPLIDIIDCERENLDDSGLQQQNKVLFEVQHADAEIYNTFLMKTHKKIDTSNTNPLPGDKKHVNLNEKEDKNISGTCSSNMSYNICHDSNVRDIIVESNSVLLQSAIDSTKSANPEVCEELQRNFLPSKDHTARKNLVDIEVLENDPENVENLQNGFRKDVSLSAISDRQYIPKAPIKKRQRVHTSEACDSQNDVIAHEVLCIKDTDTIITSRKHHISNSVPTKHQPKSQSEDSNSEIEHRSAMYRQNRVTSRRRIYSRKHQQKEDISSDLVSEEENCKKDTYLSITCRKQSNLRGGKRQSEMLSSVVQDSEYDCTLAERITPSVMPTSDQRRSSIEFQPVVRMMKIDDQVDMDHSILSVTVASNRRLRSSSSPRSNAEPPKKRLKTNRGQFGRWLKNS